MKIKRYPKSNRTEYKVTDVCDLKEKFQNDSIEMDITIDQTGQRHSQVSIGFNLDDYEFLHNRYVENLKEIIDIKTGEIANQKKVLDFFIWLIWSDYKTEPFFEESLNQIKKIIEFGFVKSLSKVSIDDPVDHNLVKNQIEKLSYDPTRIFEE